MRVDPSTSQFQEDPAAEAEFTASELKMLRVLLRRLRFLEAQIKAKGGLRNGGTTGGAAWAEWEQDALAYALEELGFLPDSK